MRRCAICNEPLLEGARFCINCGTPVPESIQPTTDMYPEPAPESIQPTTDLYPQPAQTEQPKKAKKSPWIAIVIAVTAVSLLGVLALLLTPILREQWMIRQYNSGVDALSEKDYATALTVFTDLGDYEDAATLAAYAETGIAYENARALMQSGDYRGALAILEGIGRFEDSEALTERCRAEIYEQEQQAKYDAAVAMFESGDYEAALPMLMEVRDRGKAEEMIETCKRRLLTSEVEWLMDNEQYEEALAILESEDGVFVEDRAARITVCKRVVVTNEVRRLLESGDYRGALALLESEDGKLVEDEELIRACRLEAKYHEAIDAYEDGLYYTAYCRFNSLGDYKDSAARAKKCVQSKPKTGETYRNPSYRTASLTLTIKPPSDGTCTYFRLYIVENGQEILVSSIFINSGGSAKVSLPAGTYVFKQAYSKGDWFGEKEMFGDDATYQRLSNTEDSTYFNLKRGSQYTLTLRKSGINGNVDTRTEGRNNF